MLYDTIFKRKSVRKFDFSPLDPDFLEGIHREGARHNAFFPDIKWELKILRYGEAGGPGVIKAPWYLAFYSRDDRPSRIAGGLVLQYLQLWFSANGIGSVWLGTARPGRETKPEDPSLRYIIMLAFGLPGEPLHRTAVSEFKRKDLGAITSIKEQDMLTLLEAVRLAPSALNRQPWYFTGTKKRLDLWCAKKILAGDLALVDMGIALCHLRIAAGALGLTAKLEKRDPPPPEKPGGYDYVISLRLDG